MKKLLFYSVGLVIAFASVAGSSLADEADAAGKADCATQCATECSEECASACPGCAVTKAMATLPKMTYQVGEESTCCDQQAAKLATDQAAPIHYVVVDKVFESRAEAMSQLAEVTEKFVADFATPHTCDVSGKTAVCGLSLTCGESAQKMAAIAKAAMDTVQISYKVGDESCDCPHAADSLAQTSGKPKTYVIGETETCCDIDARIQLAHAKFKAAVTAIAKAQQESTETVAVTSEA